MATTFEYSVLRLVPDPARGEQVNIGIVAFLSDTVDVRVFPTLAKVRALHPSVNQKALEELPRALASMLGEGTPAERHAILLRFPLVNASQLGWFSCEPADYEERLQRLIKRLVLTPAKPRAATTTRLATEMKAAFLKNNLLSEQPGAINQHLVVPNFPVVEAEGLHADFALKNGAMHFTAVVDLRGNAQTIRGEKRGQTAIKAVMFARAKELYRNCHRLGVYVADQSTVALVDHHLAMLRHDADELYDYSDADQRAEYMRRILQAADRASLV